MTNNFPQLAEAAADGGWDKWVAIGTLVLAGVTLIAVLVPIAIELWRRGQEKQQESRLRTSLMEAMRNEVEAVTLQLKMGAKLLTSERRFPPGVAQRSMQGAEPTQCYLLDRFLDRMHLFEGVSDSLTKFAADVMNLRLEMRAVSCLPDADHDGIEEFWRRYDDIRSRAERLVTLGNDCAAKLVNATTSTEAQTQ